MTAGTARRGWGRRLRELSWARLGLLAEAFGWLLAARAALAVLPVRWLLGQRRSGAAVGNPEEVAWAVLAVARRSPIKFVCFPQCLAAAAMLARRGAGSRLHYGVRREQGRLKTHTWLEVGGQVVVGGEMAAQYTELAIY